MSQSVCGCDGTTYDNAMKCTGKNVIIRDYGDCPACSPACKSGQQCCPGCFDTFTCVAVPYGGVCPVQKCSPSPYGYGN
jgi:hypothetical protein